jgi:hypothetical protein
MKSKIYHPIIIVALCLLTAAEAFPPVPPAGGFNHQQIEVARVIDVVADGAFGVADAMVVAEGSGHAASAGGRGPIPNS